MGLMGLPSLPKLSGKGILNSALGSAQSSLWQMLAGNVTWGIYEAGSSTELALDVTTVLEVTVNEESEISDYRIQTGSFVSFNKVPLPREIPFSFVKTGSDDELQDCIEWLKMAVSNAGMDYVYDILVPEKSFTDMALVRYSIERKRENGSDALYVDCWFKEVREAPIDYLDINGEANTINAISADAKPTSLLKQVQSKVSDIKSGISNVFDTVSNKLEDMMYEGLADAAFGVAGAWQNVSAAIDGNVTYVDANKAIGFTGGSVDD